MKLVFLGQVRGGKNAVKTTRTGRRYPSPLFAAWAAEQITNIRAQLPRGWQPRTTETRVRLHYVAGDRRRRDFPAICDGIWHVLERAGVVADDALLWPAESTRGYDPQCPGATVEFLP